MPVPSHAVDEAKLLELLNQISAKLPLAYPTTPSATTSSNALDIFFKGLVLACATGIGWMTISLPVMKDNLDDLKTAVSKIEDKTEDRFTRADFLRERESIDAALERNAQAINRNTQALKDRTEFMADTKSDLRTLKKHHDEN